MDRLNQLREEIACCDRELLALLEKRNALSEKVMEYKEEKGLSIFQLEQEERQNKRWKDVLKESAYSSEILEVLECIRRNSKKIQGRRIFTETIFLIGFMGVGKTTVSNFLKTYFALDVVEMDACISEREGMQIPDIFSTFGEAYFRDLETAFLKEPQEKGKIISCGGGVVLREENILEMKRRGQILWLSASPETIYQRVKDCEDRPLLQGRNHVEGISALMKERQEKYKKAADFEIDTNDKTVLEVCEDLMKLLLKRSKKSC